MSICKHGDEVSNFPTWKHVNNSELLEFCKAIKPILKIENLKIRYEGGTVDFYPTDKATFDKLCLKLAKFIKSITEPESEEELKLLQESHKNVLVNHLPHKTYKYRVTFRSMPEPVKEGLYKWASNYKEDTLKMPASTASYLKGGTRYLQDPIIYITNEKMLSMVGMASSGYIKKTEHFIPRASLP
jgi:hypothetical protein